MINKGSLCEILHFFLKKGYRIQRQPERQVPPFDWLTIVTPLVSGESTFHQVTGYELRVILFDARSRIFLPFAKSCAPLFCCRLAILTSQLGWLVGNSVMLIGLQFSKGLCVFLFRQSSEWVRCLSKSRGKGVHSPNFTRLRYLKSVPFK